MFVFLQNFPWSKKNSWLHAAILAEFLNLLSMIFLIGKNLTHSLFVVEFEAHPITITNVCSYNAFYKRQKLKHAYSYDEYMIKYTSYSLNSEDWKFQSFNSLNNKSV